MNETEPTSALVQGLMRAEAYWPETVNRVEFMETHISWVFLTEKYGYKVKKPVRNDFIDYSSLTLRHSMCLREIELDRRYAPELYVGVVPITDSDSGLVIDGDGEIREYAVKMHRFPRNALLDQRLLAGQVAPREIKTLAARIAAFHLSSKRADPNSSFAEPATILREAIENLDAIAAASSTESSEGVALDELRSWTEEQYFVLAESFSQRKSDGWIRECHGDLHCGNVVLWDSRLTPFDGIEFNDSFRWIDVLSDVAFLGMDLTARGHYDLAHLLISTYLEATGDYRSLRILRWYMVYRAMVRAKVASIFMSQHAEGTEAYDLAERERSGLLKTAVRLSRTPPPRLWITHGLSGSGKSYNAEKYVTCDGAIRIRADVERKRLVGLAANERPSEEQRRELYSTGMTVRTYELLLSLSEQILSAGYSVVVDATFLKRSQRKLFESLATKMEVPFAILAFTAKYETLRQRIVDRAATADDASDADVHVLDLQVNQLEPLSDSEQASSIWIDET